MSICAKHDIKTGNCRLFFRLLGWRLRFYADASLKLLIRRWQIWCFVLFVLSPTSMPFAAQLQVLSLPVHRLLSGSGALPIWLSLSVLAIAWTSAQADALSGGTPWRYLRTLPNITALESRVDLGVLLIADLPLLLPFAAYEFSLVYSDVRELIVNGLLAIGLAVQLPTIQQRLLRGAPLAALWILGVSLVAVLLQSPGTGNFAAAGLLALGPFTAEKLGNCRLSSIAFPTGNRLSAARRPLLNLALINFSVLTRCDELKSRLPLLAYLAAIVWFGEHWRNLGFQPPVAHSVLLSSTTPLLLQAAGLEWVLRTARKPLLPLLTSLGIDRRQWLIADLLVLEMLLVLLAAIPVAMLAQDTGLSILAIWPLAAIALALLIAHAAQDRSGRPRIVPKLLIAGGYLTSAWWLVFGFIKPI